MLSEYAILPGVFDPASYVHPSVFEVCLRNMKEPLLQGAIIRDLREGGWSLSIVQRETQWHPHLKELWKHLKMRLRPTGAAARGVPENDSGWCIEALASHGLEPLNGIIAPETVKNTSIARNAIVASVEKLASADWWGDRTISVRIVRNMQEYRNKLRLVLARANSVMFIDPHLDPANSNYKEFFKLLLDTRRPDVQPLIQIHRKIWIDPRERAGPCDTLDQSKTYWREKFTKQLAPSIHTNQKVEVFLWDNFHDRYLISDLVGILVPNGFDTTTDPKSITTWTRLSRGVRDDVQREFEPTNKRLHDCKASFEIQGK